MTLLTIQKNVQKEIVIEKSRFICTLQKVEDEAAAVGFIKELKKKYWDATHNCSAYILGENMQCQKSSDDGEPSGTAGIPMLEVLKKRNLHNVVAVVTRYFGGIKLGSGGLIRAYSKSVIEAIDLAGIAKKQLMSECYFEESINESGKILNILYQQELFSVVDVQYNEQAKIVLRLKAEDVEGVNRLLRELLSKDIELTMLNQDYIEVPCYDD